jgi:hypothetical protein
MVTPDLRAQHVGVHGEGDGGGGIVARELAEHVTHLLVRGAATTELDGNESAARATGAQLLEGIDGKDTVAVAVGDAGFEVGPEPLCDRQPVGCAVDADVDA